jgi:hypothetical protein
MHTSLRYVGFRPTSVAHGTSSGVFALWRYRNRGCGSSGEPASLVRTGEERGRLVRTRVARFWVWCALGGEGAFGAHLLRPYRRLVHTTRTEVRTRAAIGALECARKAGGALTSPFLGLGAHLPRPYRHLVRTGERRGVWCALTSPFLGLGAHLSPAARGLVRTGRSGGISCALTTPYFGFGAHCAG